MWGRVDMSAATRLLRWRGDTGEALGSLGSGMASSAGIPMAGGMPEGAGGEGHTELGKLCDAPEVPGEMRNFFFFRDGAWRPRG